jgi:HK97 gp10 family phage protein
MANVRASTDLATQRANKAAMTRGLNNLRALVEVIPEGVHLSLELLGKSAVDQIKASIVDAPTPANGSFTVHSAPGDPPYSQTGRLRGAYEYDVFRPGSRQVVQMDIRNDQEHWIYQEFGTRKMAPRPHIRPAVRRIRDTMAARIVSDVTVLQRARRAGMKNF